ncbi:DUF2842 domain-containing protein [Govanella unica]|uniref:DUF2842 domain-containing protein n=1 Tax=Govanella unica TaxID=2975056 RepID=A0A9X3TY94_9PROT|nr:DUF2842 domain-containing protein [Govania unica]MDA5194021.1 DUF2842 domain-containing protein [Govania unica]
MSPRTRRTLGLLTLTFGLFFYCILVMLLASVILPVNGVVDLLFYVVTGIVWIFPAYWVLKKTNG